MCTCGGAAPSGSGDAAATADADSAVPAAGAVAPSDFDSQRLGDGFLVWESSRSGKWRIWTRRFDGSGLRQLTPDEPGGQHCCAHLSPDGSRMTYVALPPSRGRYPQEGSAGTLYLMDLESGETRVLTDQARTYHEHRAALWKSDDELIYITGDGHTVLHDLASDEVRRLTDRPRERHGFLMNATLSHATTGRPTFAPFDAERGRVERRDRLGGCQPYFTHDGRWGFWTAGAGGPIDRIDLASGATSTILRKNDALLPDQQGYLYFPMVSRDGRLLAVGASDNAHDHFKANYDIFVFEIDPATLVPAGPGIRYTSDPATDRFPDLYSAPLPLGRHRGEAPFQVRFEAPGPGNWDWSYGDGSEGAEPVHAYSAPGVYAVEARQDDRTMTGQVVVLPAQPPSVAHVGLRRAGEGAVVRFDEDVDLSAVEVTLAPGEIVERRPGDDGRSLELSFAEAVRQPSRLRVAGVRDRAQSPNAMAAVELTIDPPAWPSREQDIAFLWQNGQSLNAVFDPALDSDRTFVVESVGGATLDHDHAMVLGRGHFAADADSARHLLEAAQNTNEITLELTVTSALAGQGDGARIVAFGGERGYNFRLFQRGDRLVYLLLAQKPRAERPSPPVEVARLEAGRPTHLVLSYAPGRLAVYADGELVHADDTIQGDFYAWQPRQVVFGNDLGGGKPWVGAVEGVAVYNRFLEADEAAENALRYRELMAEREAVPRLEASGTVQQVSEPPTLQEISPYREALAVVEYRVEEVIAGELSEGVVRVAEWAILDGRTLTRPRPGQRVERLILEPLAANTQLEGLVVRDTLPAGIGELYYRVPW